MTFGISSSRTIDGVEIQPGAVISADPNFQLRFSVQTICETVEPDSWRGQVLLNGTVIIRTEPVASRDKAIATAKDELIKRFSTILGAPVASS